MAEADGKIVVGFEAKADAAQAAAEGKRMAQAVQQGASSVSYGGGAGPRKPVTGSSNRVWEAYGRAQAEAELGAEKLRLRQEAAAKKLRETPPPLPKQESPAGVALRGFSALSATGVPYISTLVNASLSPLGAAVAAVALQFVALRRVLSEYNDAAALYSKALRSGGLSISYTAGKANLSSVLGVSEEDVLNYAQAVQYIGPKISQATRLQVEYNSTMTATAWEMRAAQQNLKSVWTVLAGEAAPAIRVFASAVNELAASSASAVKSPYGKTLLSVLFPTMALGASFGSLGQGAPALTANMSRTPASSWERMGLGMGYGSGNSLLIQNTRRTATGVENLKAVLEKLANLVGAGLEKVGLAVKETDYP